jgi:hypothetical protein
MALRLFPHHTGVWEGTYTRIAPSGEMLDRFRSKLSIRMLPGGRYHQVNEYFWDDGHTELHDFGMCQFNDDDVLVFDNPRILGKAWETDNSVVLTWSYKDRPGSNLYEIIDLIGPKQKHRIRCWKWSYNDEFEGLTMIDERKTADEADIPADFWETLPQRRFLGNSRSNR